MVLNLAAWENLEKVSYFKTNIFYTVISEANITIIIL
jgi:hypothetical protein